MRVTINVIRDRMRSHWYRRVTVDAAAGLLQAVPSAEDQALRGQPSALLDAVRRLPPDQQNIVLLFYVADQSLQAISETLGIRASTVKTRLHRARGRLARILENERRTSDG
jgi:RNA polymerase sigma-70 factor (ECF subfamily)